MPPDSGSNWDAQDDWDDCSSNTDSTHSDQSWSSSWGNGSTRYSHRNHYWGYDSEGDLDDFHEWSKQDRNDYCHSKYHKDWSFAPSQLAILEDEEDPSEELDHGDVALVQPDGHGGMLRGGLHARGRQLNADRYATATF